MTAGNLPTDVLAASHVAELINGLVKALRAALADKKSKGFVIKPNGEARYRYKWDGMTVQFNLYPKGPGKTSIVAKKTLPGADAVEPYRALWKAAFAALAQGLVK